MTETDEVVGQTAATGISALTGTLVFVAVALAASGLFWWSVKASQDENRRNEIVQRMTVQSYSLSRLATEALDGSERAEHQWLAVHEQLGEGVQSLEAHDPAMAAHVKAIQGLHERSGELFSRLLVSSDTANSWQRRRLYQQLEMLLSEVIARMREMGDELRAHVYRVQTRSSYLFAGSMLLLLGAAVLNHLRMSGLNRELGKRHDRVAALAEERARQAVALQSEMARRHRAEQQNIESEKLASVGTLAAGVAHELNNPLMGVINYVEYCCDRLPVDDRKHGILEDAAKEARRCVDIVRDLLTFSRPGGEASEAVRAVDVKDLVNRVLRLLSYRTLEVEIETDLPPDLPRVAARPNKLQQVFLNVVVNALDALEVADSGADRRLSVRAARHEEGLDVQIKDNGRGIPKKRLARVFDPFYTTKEVGKGTGLGLPIAKNLLEEMGGALRLESEPEGGTIVTIRLPLAVGGSGALNTPVQSPEN